jgi:hypothetical protein
MGENLEIYSLKTKISNIYLCPCFFQKYAPAAPRGDRISVGQ